MQHFMITTVYILITYIHIYTYLLLLLFIRYPLGGDSLPSTLALTALALAQVAMLAIIIVRTLLGVSLFFFCRRGVPSGLQFSHVFVIIRI